MSLRPHITFLTRLATFLPLFATIAAFGQQSAGTFRIAGSVTDYATGEPVVGANVVAYDAGGRPHGAAVGADGRFAFNCPTKAATLRVSMLGYRNETVKLVPGRTDYDIRLREAPSDVGEVVVTGFVDKKRESYTGATHVIQRQEIENMVHTNVLNIIQLQTPGFEIFDDIANGSDPNKIPDMVLRGRSSFIEGDQTNVPLFILDGTEVDISYVFDMPSDDIESISVLKDASASAIYGAKASAGVILVTTKKGAAGQATVSYSNNIGWTQPTTPTDFITNGYDYATIVNDLYFSRYAYNAFNYTDADWAALEARRYDTTEHPDRPWVVIGDDGKYHYYGNFDWYHSIYNTNRFHQEHNLSLSGGGKDVNYYVSGRYYQQDGVLGGNMIRNKENYKNYSFRAKFDAQLFKWAKWSTNASLNAVNQKYPGPLNEAQTIAALEENVAPMFVPYNPDGSIVMYPADLRNVALGKGRTAALADPTNKHTIENLSLTLSNSLQLKLHKDLTFDASYNINNYRRLYKDRTAANIYSDAVGVTKTTTHYQKDTYRERPYEYTYHNVDAYFTYEHSWNKEHNFKAVAGMNYEKYRLVDNIVEQFGLGSDQIDSFNSVNDDTYWLVQQDISAYKTLGFFARINYDYKGKYLFEANLGVTGSEQFAPSNRYGVFPSGAVGYYISKEPFWQKAMPWWSTMKIRYSNGWVGSDASSAQWLYYSAWKKDGNYIKEDGIANLEAKWETAHKQDLGIEMGWLQNTLTLNVDFFDETREDIFLPPIVTMFVGGVGYKEVNMGAVKKHGMEIELNYSNSTRNGFHYNAGVMFGLNENRITRFNDAPYIPAYQKTVNTQYGAPRTGNTLIDDKYFNSIDELHGYPLYTKEWTNITPGIYKFLDYKPDGIIDITDLHTLDGSTYAPVTYSFNLGFSYKGLTFKTLWTGTIGKYINYRRASIIPFYAGDLVVHAAHLNYWRPDNHNSDIPALSFNDQMYAWSGGTSKYPGYDLALPGYTWRKSDYLTIKEVMLAYKFSGSKIKRALGVESLGVTLSCNNLWTFFNSSLKDTDPQRLTTASNYYPTMRILKLSVNLAF